MNIDNHVYDALKILIKISENAQETSQESLKCLSTFEWIKEYCTVRASTARRGGHTTAILKLMEDNEMHIGCVFQNYRMTRMFQDFYNQRNCDRGKLEFCISKEELRSNKLAGRTFKKLDALVIDNSFFYSKKDEDKMYQLACLLGHTEYRTYGNTNRKFFIIFLQ